MLGHSSALVLLLCFARLSEPAATWTGPRVTPTFTQAGIASISINGVAAAPHFLVGNTQGGLDDDFAAWAVELGHARAAGVRIFGICTDGSDLLGPATTLTNHTRQMIDFVLSIVPDALILPRVPIGAGPAWEKAVDMDTNGARLNLSYSSPTSS